ncbi:NLI interacting factor-like phosphatase-domain-containing protein [Blastocladiella britannica]|nr:NLI interacting factor-like phosphatase-domain-containing protein [Blastocladiella britannica]
MAADDGATAAEGGEGVSPIPSSQSPPPRRRQQQSRVDADSLLSSSNPPSPSTTTTTVRARRRIGIPPSTSGSIARNPTARSHHPALRRKTLVLDLDETLIHSTSRGLPTRRSDHLIEVSIDGHKCMYYVYKRPHVDFFLRKVAEWYKVVIFTASLQEYADPVIDWLEGGKRLVRGRYFRQSCIQHGTTYLKDLRVIDADLSQVCLLDNSPISFAINQANGIPIEGWVSDSNDEALLELLPFLDALRFAEDVRSVLGLRLYTPPH